MEIDEHLVERLVGSQFPHLRHLRVSPVQKQGWDNRTFRLGGDLAVRLPSNASYAAAVEKEARALTLLAGHQTVKVPEVVAIGEPSEDYPLPWSIRRWVAGDTLEIRSDVDQESFAASLGACLNELQRVPAGEAPLAGKHSFFRGCHPSVYGDEVQMSLDRLDGDVDRVRCLGIWRRAVCTVWTEEPVWFHGDVAVGNILARNSEVTALIDFGTCGAGDPACDYVMAWTWFDAGSRSHFRSACRIDDDTWNRARGWALWKALACLSGLSSPDTNGVQARALNEILEDET